MILLPGLVSKLVPVTVIFGRRDVSIDVTVGLSGTTIQSKPQLLRHLEAILLISTLTCGFECTVVSQLSRIGMKLTPPDLLSVTLIVGLLPIKELEGI